jgi:MFS family permease
MTEMAALEKSKLFVASSLSLVTTAMVFAIRGDIANDMAAAFHLSNEQLGLIFSPAFWCFTIAIFIVANHVRHHFPAVPARRCAADVSDGRRGDGVRRRRVAVMGARIDKVGAGAALQMMAVLAVPLAVVFSSIGVYRARLRQPQIAY